MSDSDPFLTRWSRRKSVAAKTPAQPSDTFKAAAEARPDATQPTPASNEKVSDKRAEAGNVEQGLDFDPASLPSIDSIGAKTDISAFLKPGVPSDLRHAALRRVWSTDPQIRDFKGLQENDWNFNDPKGIPGFGELSPDTDVKKMVQALFGETEGEPTTAVEVPAANAQALPNPREASGQGEGAIDHEKPVSVQVGNAAHNVPDVGQSDGPPDNVVMQRIKDGAVQDREDKAGPAEVASGLRPRSHGGALPR